MSRDPEQLARQITQTKMSSSLHQSSDRLRSSLKILTQRSIYSYSPENVASELWTTDLASTRWLGLLATDAAQADSGFSLAPSPAPEDDEQRRGPAAHGPPDATNMQSRLTSLSDSERKTWQADRYITLTNHEAVLFRHFTERSSRWLDFLDPDKLFSTYAVRLALRNAGLMNAILALSGKHLNKLSSSRAEDSEQASGGDGECVRYYYETLRYVQEALAYPSYTNSEELNATAIVISAYEMLDESDGRGNWQRHLKGVFWIQRSQNVNGYSGGLQQAVWWAWLRQDLWAAFREKRRCLSFWAPYKDYHESDQHGLAHMAIYLLSQAVNFCADSRLADSLPVPNPSMTTNVVLAGNELSEKMERWKAQLGNEFKPLPTATSPSDVFAPLWLHPPQFGLRIGIGGDDTGFSYKSVIAADLAADPRVTAETAAVDGFDRAVLICGTGLRVAISANKVPGVRAVDDFETVCRMIYLMSLTYPSANCTVS
ncbi:D-erythrulose-4-phosphate isomerase 1 [Colletotrichum spinosum]|uniref:D-erythrulose-4-phosphate isomerase 1 n=1 Tax=Colletotrichum spinosum TaxID=1347390 RepID=A0A4R8Q143_9PEZI|nr:D-erythrulose-4-phosphate isomerase 1 [Colletotrichum spinosum]